MSAWFDAADHISHLHRECGACVRPSVDRDPLHHRRRPACTMSCCAEDTYLRGDAIHRCIDMEYTGRSLSVYPVQLASASQSSSCCAQYIDRVSYFKILESTRIWSAPHSCQRCGDILHMLRAPFESRAKEKAGRLVIPRLRQQHIVLPCHV